MPGVRKLPHTAIKDRDVCGGEEENAENVSEPFCEGSWATSPSTVRSRVDCQGHRRRVCLLTHTHPRRYPASSLCANWSPLQTDTRRVRRHLLSLWETEGPGCRVPAPTDQVAVTSDSAEDASKEGIRPCARTHPSPPKSSVSGTSSTRPMSCWAGWPATSRSCFAVSTSRSSRHHVDTGDFVIIINADKVALSGNKLEQKKAYRHSGYPGGLRSITYGELMDKHPERAVEKAVKGMLPKNALGRKMIKQAQGLRRSRAPAPGAAAGALRDHPDRPVVSGLSPAALADGRRRVGKLEENRG